MKISTSTMAFRRQRANELRILCDSISKLNVSSNITVPIFKAINALKDDSKIPTLKNEEEADPNVWGYDIDDFILPVETIKHIKPTDIKRAELSLNLKLRAYVYKWQTFEDPFLELSFKVIVKGIGNEVRRFGFHIDKHNSEQESDEPHPLYHLQYDLNPNSNDSPNLGDLFFIDTPRIMHVPLDFILGVSYLTSNFSPSLYNKLSKDRSYINLSRTYQENIWKPYYHTIANHWKPFNQSQIIWDPIKSICPIIT